MLMTKDPTQKELILRDLKAGEHITQLDALHKYGCMRLGARISDLKKDGEPVLTKTKQIGKKKVAEYYMYNGKLF